MKFNEKELRNKVLLDIFTDIYTLIPFGLGFTAMVVGWAIGFSSILAGGFLVAAGGLATGATRFVLLVDERYQQAFQKMKEDQKKDKNKGLDLIYKRLLRNIVSRDKKDKEIPNILSDMRTIFDAFNEDVESGKLTPKYNILDKINVTFDETIKLFQLSVDILESIEKIKTDEARQNLIDRRQKVLDLIRTAFNKIVSAIDEVRRIQAFCSIREYEQAYSELDELLAFSKDVDSEMESLVNNEYAFLKEHIES